MLKIFYDINIGDIIAVLFVGILLTLIISLMGFLVADIILATERKLPSNRYNPEDYIHAAIEAWQSTESNAKSSSHVHGYNNASGGAHAEGFYDRKTGGLPNKPYDEYPTEFGPQEEYDGEFRKNNRTGSV